MGIVPIIPVIPYNSYYTIRESAYVLCQKEEGGPWPCLPADPRPPWTKKENRSPDLKPGTRTGVYAGNARQAERLDRAL